MRCQSARVAKRGLSLMAAAMLVLQPTTASAASPAVDEWVQRVSSHYLRVRLTAQYDYSQLAVAPADSVPALIVELDNSQSVVREYATAALGELEAPPDMVVPALLRALSDPVPVVQSQAALALAKIGEPAGKAIVAKLLSADGLADPKEKVISWDDYAVASLMLMQEKSAPAIAEGLVSLGRFADVCPIPTADENGPDSANGDANPDQLRPGYVGDELKFRLLEKLARRMNAEGARTIATQLVDAADASDGALRLKLSHLAVEILADIRDPAFVDSDGRRSRRLAKALLDRPCSENLLYQAEQGSLTIALIEENLARGNLVEAGELIRFNLPAGAALEPWAAKIAQYLFDSREKVRSNATGWIASHPNDPIPLPDDILFRLAASPDSRTAFSAVNYLSDQGNRSEALVRAYQGLLQLPDLEENQRQDIIRALALLRPEMPDVEPILATMAKSETTISHEYESCSAVEALSEIESPSEESRNVFLEAVRSGTCVSEAAEALLNAGLTVDQILVGSSIPTGEAGEKVRNDVQMAFENVNSSYEEEEYEGESDEGSGVSEAELLSRVKREGWLSLRDQPVAVIPGNTPDDFGIRPILSVYSPIAELEFFASTEFEQPSPLLSVLADLKIFELVQEQVGDAAAVRLTLAFPAYRSPPPPPPPPPPEPERDGSPVGPLPNWPWSWPPPVYSSWNTLELAGLTPRATVGAVFARLTRALEQAGFYENRLYAIPQGVAVMTHVEETTDRGARLPEDKRWGSGPPSMFSAQYWAETMSGIRKYHRQFVFFLTRVPNISGGTTTLHLEQAKHPKVDGARELPPEIGSIPWNGFYLHAVVYRFNKVNSKLVPVTSDIYTRDQMRRAGIFIKQTGGM